MEKGLSILQWDSGDGRKVDLFASVFHEYLLMSSTHLPKMIFIVGAPRSGSRLLLDFLTVPKNVAWIPDRLGESPSKLSYASRANRQNWPLLGEFFLERRSAWKRVPEPAVGESFWSHYMPGFTPPDEEPYVPGPEHVSDAEIQAIQEAVKEICHRQRRDIFVAEYDGLPRIRLLQAVFPEAMFLQVIRDPRSVAYQMVKRSGGANLKLWEEREKWIALMPEALQARVAANPSTPLNFCGVLTRWYHDLYKSEMGELSEGKGLEVAYSDLLSRPERILSKILKFVELPETNRFKYFVKFHDIQESNQRAHRNLKADEADQLAEAVAALD